MHSNDHTTASEIWPGLVTTGLVAFLLVGALAGATTAQAPDSTQQQPPDEFDEVWPDVDSLEEYWLDGWAGRNGWDALMEMQDMEQRLRELYGGRAFGFGHGEMLGDLPEFRDVELTDEGDFYRVEFQVEDLDESSLQIEVHQGALMIHGRHESFKKEKDASGHATRKFRAAGSFSRVVSLPEPVIPDEMTADYREGVLTIELSKETS